MKKILLAVALCCTILLSGCSMITNIVDPLPDDYVDGVKVAKEYPDDELEIYDDAIVFDCEDDDDQIELSYGTTDDVDDVADHYEDLFEDGDFQDVETDDDDDEYHATGRGSGYEFEISAEESRRKYEERAFATVVEVEIRFTQAQSTDASTDTTAPSTDNDLVGFWLMIGAEGEAGETYKTAGFAIEIKGNTLIIYDEAEIDMSEVEYTKSGASTIDFSYNGEDTTLICTFETVKGYDCVTMGDNDGRMHFVRSSYDELISLYDADPSDTDTPDVSVDPETGTIPLSRELDDDELEYLISDFNWNAIHYAHPDGTIEAMTKYNKMYFDSTDMTGTDEHEEHGMRYITWYVEDSNLIIKYEGEEEMSWSIDYKYDGTTEYLYLYDQAEGYEGDAWLYTG